MTRSVHLAALALLCVPLCANAHAHLLAATPAEGSVLTQSPANFLLKFNEAAHLTALSLQRAQDAPQKLAPLPAAATAQFTVPAPKLDPGSYTLSYRVLSDDSHIMSGSIHFRIEPAPH
jgi:methionine-rich copper-binding protein CopC